jgi:hypothetical protein
MKYFKKSSVMSFINSAQLRGGRLVDLGREDIQAVIWTQLNPLTDSVVVLEIVFGWNADKTIAYVTSEFRDHDGDGEMISHSITEVFDGEEMLCAAECYYQFHDYMGEQQKELVRRIELNNKKVMNENN